MPVVYNPERIYSIRYLFMFNRSANRSPWYGAIPAELVWRMYCRMPKTQKSSKQNVIQSSLERHVKWVSLWPFKNYSSVIRQPKLGQLSPIGEALVGSDANRRRMLMFPITTRQLIWYTGQCVLLCIISIFVNLFGHCACHIKKKKTSIAQLTSGLAGAANE